MRQRDPKRRFDAIWRCCSKKMVCEATPATDGDSADYGKEKEVKHDHGGCGNTQPEVRREGLKLNGTWKIPKGLDDEEAQQPEKGS